MIDEAAEFRLRAKHSAFESASALHGPERALFYTLASGLGYKNNSTPFLLAAQRIGLRDAGSLSGEALLFGVAGFLEPRSFDDADEITRRYLKPLWDHWWTVRDALARLVLPSSIWKMSGLRPLTTPTVAWGPFLHLPVISMTFRSPFAMRDVLVFCVFSKR